MPDGSVCTDPSVTDDGLFGPSGDLTVHITADNAYSFGYGDDTGIPTAQFIQGTRATLAAQISTCTTVPGNSNQR